MQKEEGRIKKEKVEVKGQKLIFEASKSESRRDLTKDYLARTLVQGKNHLSTLSPNLSRLIMLQYFQNLNSGDPHGNYPV